MTYLYPSLTLARKAITNHKGIRSCYGITTWAFSTFDVVSTLSWHAVKIVWGNIPKYPHEIIQPNIGVKKNQ